MAIQNFLSGGYYGKLGDTVGQRWHNKRTIRSYVVPKNPQTDKQQANRALFATANRLATEAYNVNKGSELWDTTDKSQFSQMVSTAKLRLQAGMSEADALPLYPDNYDPTVILTNVSLNWSNWGASMSWTAQSYILQETRTFAITYYDFRPDSQIWSTEMEVKTFHKGDLVNHTFLTYNNRCLPEGAYITCQTVDDASHGGSSITLPPLQVVQPSRPHFIKSLTFDTPYWLEPNQGVAIHVNGISNTQPGTIFLQADLYNQQTSEWEIVNLSFPKPAPPVDVILIDNGDTYRTPQGSTLINGTYRMELTTAIIIYTWDDFRFSLDPWPV
jgi:hypothetical protein